MHYSTDYFIQSLSKPMEFMKKILCISILFLLASFVSSVNAQILTTSMHPIIIIDTDNDDIPDEPKIEGTMGIIYNGEGILNNTVDPFNYYDGFVGIETRGNSTQGFDKKTYSIELWDEANEEISVNLFGMGGEEDWILHAMVIDKTQLRIPMSFYLAQRMGHTASEWKFVELILNGEYRGLYILTEKIKRDDDRVDIAKLDEDDLAGDSLTGGYILRIDWTWDIDMETDGFESDYQSQAEIPMFFQWYYPKANKIKPQQANYIESWMNTFEDALFSNDFKNNQGLRYTEYIDLHSFTDFLLINELSKNADGYKLSSYVHKERDSDGGKLVAGPIWDFDQTYGMSLVCSNHDPTGWTYLQNQNDCEDLESMPLWWQRMMSDELFRNNLKCRWEDMRETFFHKDSINAWIDEQVDFTADAIDRNFTVWDYFIGNQIWIEPEPIPQSYEAEIEYMKDWISDRIDWLDINMPGDCSLVSTRLPNNKRVDVQVYPNPVADRVYIEAADFIEANLYSLGGRSLGSDQDGSIDMSSLEPGVYLVQIFTKKGTETQKVIKL